MLNRTKVSYRSRRFEGRTLLGASVGLRSLLDTFLQEDHSCGECTVSARESMFKASTNVKKVADFYFSTTRIRLREGCVSTNHDIDFLPIIGRPAVATYRTEKTDREFRTREKLHIQHASGHLEVAGSASCANASSSKRIIARATS